VFDFMRTDMPAADLNRDRESHFMPRSILFASVILAVTFMLSACTSQQAGADEELGSPDLASTQDPTKPPNATPCQPSLVDKVEETVRGQNSAISKRDYSRALEFSSNRYRSGTTPELFGRMIEGAYQHLLDPGDYQLFDCYLYDGSPRPVVTITAQFGEIAMGYYLVEQDNQWRIDLAGGVGVARARPPSI
jgi:hypothetical protein